MKTIVLTTVGSTGDVVPHLALARALAARGHRVRVASHSFHRAFFESRGVEFVSVGAPLEIADFNALVDESAKKRAPIEQFGVLVRRLFLREPARQLADLRAAIADADLVVCQRFDYLGQAAAIERGGPWASVTLAPQLLRTREAPVYPMPDLGRLWNEMTWHGLESMATPINKSVAEVLASAGVPRKRLDVAGASSPHLDLVAASAHIVPTRRDWPNNTRLTGAWFLDEPDHVPDPALAEFVARHPRPLVVTFGSMGGGQGDDTSQRVLEAIARVGRPAIVQEGYAGLLRGAKAPENVLSIGHVPHEHLFALASCVIHHAGAGTSHAVARSGAPSVPVPHLFDQYYWAGRLHELGVAPKLLFRHQLTPKKLAKHIEQALALAEPARALGERVREERGLDGAVQLVEELMALWSTAPAADPP